MKTIKFIQIILFALLVCSCEKASDSYFDDGESEEVFEGENQLIYDYLLEQTIYSKFTALLNETEMDKVLKADHMVTVWAIPDSLFPDEISEQLLSSKIRFAKNHINSLALTKANLETDRVIITLASKMLRFNYQDSISMLEEVQVRRMNQLCKNGVVHEVAGDLTPRQNVYEYILESGDDYSIFRDTLLAYSDTIFMPELSIPSGVDEVGNTIYSDSVFIMENPYLPQSLSDDTRKMTYLLPRNSAIKALMLNITTFFKQVEREFTQQDTSAVMQWLMEGVIHNGEIPNYGSTKERYSIFDIKWRTDKQVVDQNYIQCSNGIVYELIGILYPKYNYMETLVIRPYLIITSMSEEDQTKYMSTSENVTAKHSNVQSNDLLWVNTSTSRAEDYVEFSSVTRDIYGKVKATKVMPGIYKLAASYRAYGCKNQKISVVVDQDKGILEDIGEYKIGADATGSNAANSKRGIFEFVPLEYAAKVNAPYNSNGLFSDEFEVKEDWGYDYLRFRITNTGKSDRFTPIYFYLEPTEENY